MGVKVDVGSGVLVGSGVAEGSGVSVGRTWVGVGDGNTSVAVGADPSDFIVAVGETLS